jgi:hypothetical protein
LALLLLLPPFVCAAEPVKIRVTLLQPPLDAAVLKATGVRILWWQANG